MSSRARLFSELAEDDFGSNASSIGVFAHSRISRRSPGVLTGFPCGSNESGSVKRRKTMGLNTRFDRMLDKISVTHSSPTHRRARSSGSSSVSSYEMPKTPVNAVQDGRLGKSFSVIKMKGSLTTGKSNSWKQNKGHGDTENLEMSSDDCTQSHSLEPLPAWLSDTFSTLEARHPLRLLLPPSRIQLHDNSSDSMHADDNDESALTPIITAETKGPDPIFAFCPMPPNPDMLENKPHQNPHILEAQYPAPAHFFVPQEGSSPPRFIISPNTHSDLTLVEMENSLSVNSTEEPRMLWTANSDSQHLTVDPLPAEDDFLQLTSSRNRTFPAHDLKTAWPPFSRPGPLVPTTSALDYSPSLLSAQFLSVATPEFSASASYDRGPSIDTVREDFAADAFISDPLLTPFPVPIADHDFFATPGPVRNAPHPVYFDSPVEDPFDSVSLQPAHDVDLDYETLDFRWEPFIRKDKNDLECSARGTPSNENLKLFERSASLQTPQPPLQTQRGDAHVAYDTRDDVYRSLDLVIERTNDWEDDDQLLTSDYQSLTSHSSLAFDNEPENPFSNPANEVLDHQTEPIHVAEADSKEAVFAPAPGIFVSPLRNASRTSTPEPNDEHLRLKNDGMQVEEITDTERQNTEGLPTTSTPNRRQPRLPPQRKTQARHTSENPRRGMFANRRRLVRRPSEDSLDDVATIECSQASVDSIESWTEPG